MVPIDGRVSGEQVIVGAVSNLIVGTEKNVVRMPGHFAVVCRMRDCVSNEFVETVSVIVQNSLENEKFWHHFVSSMNRFADRVIEGSNFKYQALYFVWPYVFKRD
jgi:hypothetical protein